MERSEPGAATARWAGARGFQDLMRKRVENVLLVSSLYDSFILAEDGRLDEVLLGEYLDLGLRHVPGIRRVSSGAEALELARDPGAFNLILSSMHVGDMSALDLARRVRESGLDTPVVVLAYDSREMSDFVRRSEVSLADRVFLWQGDVRILLAIVKYVEDRLNVEHDSGEMGVQVILLVEDNIRFYSSFLPAIYTEIVHQSHNLLPEGVNVSHKLMRIQARPKILLASTYEEAWGFFERYGENLLGILSDVEFPREGRPCRDAGAELARAARAARPDLPIMLQSSVPANESLARSLGASFLVKGSPTMLQQLRDFMVGHFSFGDFVFRLPDGTEVGRARDLKSLEERLRTVPAESLGYHGERNHFSNWLKARTEFALAHRLRPRKVSDFASLEDLRADLILAIREYRREMKEEIVEDFDRATFDGASPFCRIGRGSLGGKARGLAFVNVLLSEHRVRDRFPGVRIAVPPSVVVATDVFDAFLEKNDLRGFAIAATDDYTIRRRFLQAEFPEGAREDLAAYLDRVREPIAVRSSSLLEDSQYQPFAGIYETYMLPNNHRNRRVRLEQLLDAIKRVYASTFSPHAKAYLATTPYRIEEEKMAVVLQKVVGSARGERFYPDFSGVARSRNFYPTPPMTGDDGVAAVALGLGETVADGEACIRFCPRYPRHLVQFSSVDDILQNSQREFFALHLGGAEPGAPGRRGSGLRRFGLEAAEEDGTLAAVGSTYSPENDAVYDGTSRQGIRLVDFAPTLKHGLFPLAEILDLLLALAKEGTGTPVEIEFAVDLSPAPGEPRRFGFLQLRPVALSSEPSELEIGDEDPARLVASSPSVLGHGRVEDVRDAIVVDYHRFDRARSRDVAREVARLNGILAAEGIPYLLIGVGRWGSQDPFLGIPVTWDQISGARVILESGFRDFKVTPSQGTHFFQNLTTFRVGYFTVNPDSGQGFVDWDWLAAQPAESETEYVRHLRFSGPLLVKMNGRRNEGVIVKPGGS